MAANCSIPGFYSGLSQRLVDSPSNQYQYGMFVGLGTPSQNASMWPSITTNETSVWSTYSCAPGGSTKCLTSLSGEAFVNVSSTWQDNTSYLSLDSLHLDDGATSRSGEDTLKLWTYYSGKSPTSATSLQDFPLTFLSNNPVDMEHFSSGGSVGLGSASTVLDHLRRQNLISSKSYGLFVGSPPNGVGYARNGSLVLGGYDSNGFTGPVHAYTQVPISASNGYSPFRVKVAQMTIDLGPNRSIALLDEGGFDAYLTTTQYPLHLPRSVFRNLVSNISTASDNNDDEDEENILRLPDGFSGNLTMMLDDGFKVTFNSSWLANNASIAPVPMPLSQNATFVNSTLNQLVSDPGNLPVLLGMSFLQQVYLFVSHESSPPGFSLAQANLQSASIHQRPLCPGMTPQAATPVHTKEFSRQGLIGAVLGGVILGIAFISLIIFSLRFWLRARSQGQHAQQADTEAKSRQLQSDTDSEQGDSTVGGSIQSKFRVKTLVSFIPVLQRAKKNKPTEAINEQTERTSSLTSESSSATLVPTSDRLEQPVNVVHLSAFITSQERLADLNFGFDPTQAPQRQSQYRSSHLAPQGHVPNWRSSSVYSSD